MPVPKTPIRIDSKSEAVVCQFYLAASVMSTNQWNMRGAMELIDREYQRENDRSAENEKARQANMAGDKSKFQNYTMPVIMPQVEAAVTYYSEVFLSGLPMFGAVGTPEKADQATAMDTLMLDHQLQGGWVREFGMFFRDGFKYNLQAIEVTWCDEKIYTPETGDSSVELKETYWRGNVCKRLDLYNTFFDTRVLPAECAKYGEFSGYVELKSRVALRKMLYSMDGLSPATRNRALSTGYGNGGWTRYYLPNINPYALASSVTTAQNGTDWFQWAGLDAGRNMNKVNYSNMYEVATFYARIIPSEFGLDVPQKNTVQIWKFVVVNSSVVVYAERQSNAHDMLPIVFGQPKEDGLGFQTKSMAAELMSTQDLATSMMTAGIAGKRRAVMDRILYDPTRVRKEDINSSNPVARIPVKPNAYNKNLAEAVYAFPYRDEQGQNMMQQAVQFVGFGNIVSGGNNAQQGQFQKGNKTLHEYQDVMDHSNGRYRTMAQFTEAQTMQPIKTMLKYNILQYQDAGSFYNPVLSKQVEVNPVDLRQAAMSFKVTDGMTPADKMLGADEMQVALQVIGASPQLQAEFDVAGMYAYWLQMRGAKELSAFRRTPDQVQANIAQQQQVTDAQTPTQAPASAPQDLAAQQPATGALQ